MIEFKRTVFELNIYGEKFEISKPTGIRKQKWLNDMDNLNTKMANNEKLNGDEDFNITVELLEELGLPKEVFSKMEDEHQIELVNILFNAKKS